MLRHLWNGYDVSVYACDAPAPRYLANPSVFNHLRSSAKAPLYLSTRDCHSWFEQLALPPALREYMSQQPLKISDLIRHGDLLLEDILSYVDDYVAGSDVSLLLSTKVYPVPCTMYLAPGVLMEPVCGTTGVDTHTQWCGAPIIAPS